MKRWKLTAVVETGDDYDTEAVLRQIDCDVNRGDGVYVNVVVANRPLKNALKFVARIDE